jgi:hypothetical protein
MDCFEDRAVLTGAGRGMAALRFTFVRARALRW